MKAAKIKINFSILIWRDSPFSRATIKCDFTVHTVSTWTRSILSSYDLPSSFNLLCIYSGNLQKSSTWQICQPNYQESTLLYKSDMLTVSIRRVFKQHNGPNHSRFGLSNKVRATIGPAPTSQVPWWCYILHEWTMWEQNDLIETPTLQGNFPKWLPEKA